MHFKHLIKHFLMRAFVLEKSELPLFQIGHLVVIVI